MTGRYPVESRRERERESCGRQSLWLVDYKNIFRRKSDECG